MADETREILIKWVTDASEVDATADEIRDDIDAVKISLSDMKAVSGETTAVLRETFKATQLDPLIARVRELKALISNKEKRTLLSEEEIAAIRLEIAQTTTQIQKMQVALKAGGQEINQMFKASQNLGNSGQKAFTTAELAAKRYKDQVKLATIALQKLIDKGHSLKASTAGLRETGVFSPAVLNEAAQGFKKVTTQVKKTEKGVFDLGNTAQRVFRSIMGFIVLGILRQLITTMGELVDKGKEFQQVIVDMSISVRAVQRAGLDVTFAQLAEQVEYLGQQFQVLSKTEIRSGMDTLLLFGQQVGLTTEQIFKLSEAVAIKAVTSHKDFETAANEVSRALGQGMTRGLTSLQFQISETAIQEEAHRLKLVETGEQLDRNTKAQAIYSLMLQQAGLVAEDAAALQDQLVGQLSREEEQYKELSRELGSVLIPFKLRLLTLLNALLIAVVNFGEALSIGLTAKIRALVTPLFVVVALFEQWQSLFEGTGVSLKTFTDRVSELRNTLKELQDIRIQNLFDPQGLGDADLGENFLPPVDDIQEQGEEVDDALKDLFIKFRETIIGGKQDVAKENRNFFQDMFEKMQKFIFKMQQLAEKYAFDVQKIWTDYRDKLAEIDIKYREKEIKAEEDFQAKMRKLRNKFLMDLEDALQERDAKQILRLIRNFNAQANELRKEKEKEAKDRLREENDEKAALARRRDQRLRDLQLENAFRTKQAQDQYALERKLAWEDHVNKLKEIDIRTQERLEKITRDFKDEHDITEEGAALVAEALNRYFGPSGQIEMIYAGLLTATDNFISQWAAKLRYMQSLGLSIRGFGDTGDVPDPNQPKIDDIKKRIEDKDYGKAGALSTGFTTPTSVLSLGLPTASRPISQTQRVAVEIGLDEKLTGEIIEQTLGEVADVFIRVTK